MIQILFKEPLLLGACLLLAGSVFMLIRLPLVWWLRPIVEHELIQWDLDDNRRKLLRRQSKVFKKLEPWVVGLATGMEHHYPMPTNDDKSNHQKTPRQRLAKAVFGSRTSIVIALRAGVIEGAWTASEYIATMGLMSVLVGVGVSFFIVGSNLSLQFALCMGVVAMAVYRLQLVHLDRKIRMRQSQIRKLLPHSMEILSMTMSAGGTFQAGVEDVIRDFPGHPLANEFERMIKDLQRGIGMYDALKNIAHRIQIEEFDDILRTMSISHEHGAPASDFFRRGAKQLRTKQLRAMEIAVGKAEAKMPLPTMVITIACMIIAIAPFLVGALESGILEMFNI